MLNDATDDYLEIGEAEERALLKDDDDGDVLSIAPEDLPLESGIHFYIMCVAYKEVLLLTTCQ